jgi:ABC-type glycerol-3-phosphate transport system substrate-binding protein
MGKLSRREMLQASAAGVAATAAAALPGGVSLASAPSQDQISMRYQVFNIDAVQDMLNSYMEANPHVSIEAISVTGVDHQEVATKILATLAAGNPVDVGFACTEVTHLYAGEGLAQPLTSRLMDDAEEFMEYYADTSAALSEAMLYEGDVYQLMDTFNAANMFYNKNLLAEAGLEEPGKDWTKDDFYGMAQAMTGIDGSFGYGWINRFWGSWMPWIFVNDTNVLVEERAPGGEWFWDTFYEGDERAAGRGGGWRWPAPQANNPGHGADCAAGVRGGTDQHLHALHQSGDQWRADAEGSAGQHAGADGRPLRAQRIVWPSPPNPLFPAYRGTPSQGEGECPARRCAACLV